MPKATQRQIDLFLRYPARQVVGVVNSPADLDRLLEGLGRTGFDRSEIKVFSGDEGIRCFDPQGRYHGLPSRLLRVVQMIGDEREHMERYEQELRAGHFVVAVGTPDDRSKELAREAFRTAGGHYVDYYGPLLIEHLVA